MSTTAHRACYIEHANSDAADSLRNRSAQAKMLTQAWVCKLISGIGEHVDEACGQDDARAKSLQDQEDVCLPSYPGELPCKAEDHTFSGLLATLEEPHQLSRQHLKMQLSTRHI